MFSSTAATEGEIQRPPFTYPALPDLICDLSDALSRGASHQELATKLADMIDLMRDLYFGPSGLASSISENVRRKRLDAAAALLLQVRANEPGISTRIAGFLRDVQRDVGPTTSQP